MLLGLGIFNVSAQTLSQAKELYEKGDYAKAKPVFLKYVNAAAPFFIIYMAGYVSCSYPPG